MIDKAWKWLRVKLIGHAADKALFSARKIVNQKHQYPPTPAFVKVDRLLLLLHKLNVRKHNGMNDLIQGGVFCVRMSRKYKL